MTEANTSPSFLKMGRGYCRDCNREKTKDWITQNPEKAKASACERAKRSYHKDEDASRAKEAEWRNTHITERDEKARRSHQKLRKEVIILLGRKCVNCSNTDLRVLNVNHLKGGGTADRKDRIKVYREIRDGIRDKKDYDVRCFNCNILYDYERGIRKLPEGWTIADVMLQ